MTKPVLLALTALLPDEMRLIDEAFDVIRLYKENNPEDALNAARDRIEAVLATTNNTVSRALIEALPNLKIITLFSVGYDNVDMAAASERGVIVTNTPDIVTADTADTAMALMLAVSRRVTEGDAFVRVGKWAGRVKFPLGRSLTGKRVGILGLGRIGKAVARRCAAFDMHIAYTGRHRQDGIDYTYYDSPVSLATNSDYLVVTCKGGEETKNIVDASVLNALGETGFLVNVARGSVVNEGHLLDALRNGRIAGAGLDVFENEPHVPDELKTLDNVVLLPHIGTATLETRGAMGEMAVKNLLAFKRGEKVLTPVITS